MLERVIEERARGNPDAATAIRREVNRLVGDDLAKLKPGSPEAARLKEVMIEQGVWSQYLEVGIGPDAEIFSEGAADGGGRRRHGRRAAPEIELEQPGARGGARRLLGRPDRRRDARQ